MEIDEIINYVNKKYNENIPRPIRFFTRKKVKMIEKFDVSEIPDPLRKCTVENYIEIMKNAIADGSFKL